MPQAKKFLELKPVAHYFSLLVLRSGGPIQKLVGWMEQRVNGQIF